MAHDWLDDLDAHLTRLRAEHRHRSLHAVDRSAAVVERDGRSLVNFAGNDYLALATHPRLAAAVADAARQSGVGAGASRLVSGHLDLHQKLEQRFAAFKHAEAALVLPTGYMANRAALTALAGSDDLICLDKLNHASLIDAARASGATVRVYPHADLAKLERLLSRAGDRPGRRLIVTDAVFSMDGDCADLPALVDLRDRYGAMLIVDEAHGTGVLGEAGSGLAEHQHVAGRIDVTVSTASKALGSLGGIITAGRTVIDAIVNLARPFIYTTAVPPTQVAAIDAALDVIADEPQRRWRLAEHAAYLRGALRKGGWAVPDDPTPIIPLVVGDNAAALALSGRLEAAGVLAPAIRPPTVPPGSARLRITCRADHTPDHLRMLIDAIGRR